MSASDQNQQQHEVGASDPCPGEYWLYTNVDRGIEVTFVQESFPGPFSHRDPVVDVQHRLPLVTLERR